MATNSLLIIKAPNSLREPKDDYGFAFISEFSRYYE